MKGFILLIAFFVGSISFEVVAQTCPSPSNPSGPSSPAGGGSGSGGGQKDDSSEDKEKKDSSNPCDEDDPYDNDDGGDDGFNSGDDAEDEDGSGSDDASGAQDGDHGSGGKKGGVNDNNNNEDDGAFAWFINIVRSFDPNEIIAPAGYDSARFVSINDQMAYTINFENDPKLASAPAQGVYVYYPISPKQNKSSFRLSSFGFNNDIFQVPANRSFYSVRLDLRDSLGIFVDLIAGVDVVNNRAFWRFESIDPVTGLAPADPMVGMLPVRDTTFANGDSLSKRGLGFVTFTMQPLSSAATRDTIFATAEIVFDDNDTIVTNTEFNTIDALPPVSDVTLTAIKGDSAVIQISGNDDPNGSGVKMYDLFVAQDTGRYILYRSGLSDTSLVFDGIIGSSFRFFTLATDHTGNREALKGSPDLTINFDSTRILTDSVPPLICRGTTINVPFTVVGALQPGNIFTAQLSDTVGSFTSPLSIGTLSATGSGIITAAIPANIPLSNKYRIRVAGLLPPVIGDDNGYNITITPPGNIYYPDLDNDGFGNILSPLASCAPPVGYVSDSTDCNDNNAATNPLATEICNGYDDDCDQLTDEGCAVAILTVKAFVEGFYTGNQQMSPVLFNAGLSIYPTATDSLTIELRDDSAPYNVEYMRHVILHVNGTAEVYLPDTVVGNSYYFVIKHRNSIETWSKLPVNFVSSTLLFDFSAP